MKYIRKNAEPEQLARWKSAHPAATYSDDLCNFRDAAAMAARTALKNSLLAEQKYLCCYCECRISDANSHIEHFRPKDSTRFPELQLTYDNLLASCTKQPTGSPDEHCGHHKGNFYSEDLVSPLETDCSDHFAYKMDGTIVGCDLRGQVTVEKLHLDSTLLNNQRKRLIDDFLDMDDEDELQTELAAHLDETSTMLNEFFTMVEYLHASRQL